MDIESLSLIIRSFNKSEFETAVKLVFSDVFKLKCINEDTLIVKKGQRSQCDSTMAYYIAMSNAQSIDKDLLKKKIRKYNLSNLYIIFKEHKSEADLAKGNLMYSAEFGIIVNCLCSRTLSNLLIEAKIDYKLFEGGYDYRPIIDTDVDYLAAAFHSFTIASPEVVRLKGQVYDDAILFKVSSCIYANQEDLVNDVIDYLKLSQDKQEVIKKRVVSLQSKGQIIKQDDGLHLLDSVNAEIESRKKAYLYELDSLSSAQTDLMQEDYHIEWNLEDSKHISTLLAFAAIEEKFKLIREAKTKIEHPILNFTKGCKDKIVKFLEDNKGLEEEKANDALSNLAQLAASHPLIIKITRACMYLALEGSNPLSAAAALGANSWSDFKVMLEPTVAIPYICYRLYNNDVPKTFSKSIESVHTALSMTSSVSIPYFYINECAGHLLSARKYNDLDLNPEEMAHSSNAFVANYYFMLLSGSKMPATFMDYLATFSPAIRYEKSNIKQWVREIMNGLTKILTDGQVTQEFLPHYERGQLKDYETDYAIVLEKRNKEKPPHLVQHDEMALKYINDQVNLCGEHWIILSYDSILSDVGNSARCNGWVCSPRRFLDMTHITRPLSETQMVSVLHNVASFSEKTLSASATIMDRIVEYASDNLKNWEFRNEIEKFKKELKDSLKREDLENDKELIKRTDDFLKSKGINIKDEDFEVEQPEVTINNK